MNNEGASQTSPSGTCTDLAGNVSAPVTATDINSDKTPPVASASPSPALAALSDPTTVSANGSGQTANGSYTDRAGNSDSATLTGINIDTHAPQVTP